MALSYFTVLASCLQVKAQYGRTRRCVCIGGVVYMATAGVLHFWIGSLADWTSTLTPLLGRAETAALIQAQYTRLMPAMGISYAGMLLFILGNAYAILTKKTILPRKMFWTHMIFWQIVFVLIPDVRHVLGAEVSTWDFVLSQGSGNAALMIWMVGNAIWARRQMAKEGAGA